MHYFRPNLVHFPVCNSYKLIQNLQISYRALIIFRNFAILLILTYGGDTLFLAMVMDFVLLA